jgi:hypothetical protein
MSPFAKNGVRMTRIASTPSMSRSSHTFRRLAVQDREQAAHGDGAGTSRVTGAISAHAWALGSTGRSGAGWAGDGRSGSVPTSSS